jgi:hypothetical protein
MIQHVTSVGNGDSANSSDTADSADTSIKGGQPYSTQPTAN